MAKRINPADATRLQRLLSVTVSGGKRLTRHQNPLVDAVLSVLAVVLIIAIFVALP
jgi:tRNA A37 N6-isopentenylltransferase MiaA